jgi:branched-chain amino acid transport system ATP-binding protein
MLQLQSVSRHFGGLKVLQDVSFDVPTGGIFGLIGPNGAGKTTVVNLVTGLLPPTSGDIRFDGASLVGRKPHQITAGGIARTFQNIRVFKEMTLLENVIVGMHGRLATGRRACCCACRPSGRPSARRGTARASCCRG